MLHLEHLDWPHVKYRCVISQSRGDVHFKESFRGYPVYELGVRETPRYRVHTDDSDNPWRLEFVVQNHLFTTAILGSEPSRMLSSRMFSEFGNDSLRVIPQLPEGEYLLCAFPEGGSFVRKVLMGNFDQDVPFDVLSFGRFSTLDDAGVSISAFGRHSDSQVDVGQLLIGVTFLNFIGCGHNNTGIWLFNMTEERVQPPLARPTAIVPVTGALVPRWWASESHLRWWHEHAAEVIEKTFA